MQEHLAGKRRARRWLDELQLAQNQAEALVSSNGGDREGGQTMNQAAVRTNSRCLRSGQQIGRDDGASASDELADQAGEWLLVVVINHALVADACDGSPVTVASDGIVHVAGNHTVPRRVNDGSRVGAQVEIRIRDGAEVAFDGGIVAENEVAANMLEVAAQALAKNLGVDHLELRYLNKRNTNWPTQDLYVTFRKKILLSEDDNGGVS